MQAAIYADGSTAGAPERVSLLVERRRAILETTREQIRRNGAGAGSSEIKEWAGTIRISGRGVEAMVPMARRQTADAAAGWLEKGSRDDALERLRKTEVALAAGKPPL
jgi:hypothetical protein